MVSTLLTPGCDECYGCDTPPPPQGCRCDPPAYNQRKNMFVRINVPVGSGVGCCGAPFYGGDQPFSYLLPTSEDSNACGWGVRRGGAGQLPCFTDTAGIGWGFAYRSVQIAAKKPVSAGSDLFVPADTIALYIQDVYWATNTALPIVASITYFYDFGVCGCIPDQTIAISDLQVWKTAWPNDAAPACSAVNWTSIDIVNLGDCGGCSNGCCDSLEATGITAANKFNIGIAADSCRPFAELGLKTLTKTGACTYVWSQTTASGSCFTDGVGAAWQHVGDSFTVTSVNTASNRPCTTSYLRMLFERLSDSAPAYLQWNYDYDYCSYTAGTLALSSTENSFPNGAPPFPSASVVAV